MIRSEVDHLVIVFDGTGRITFVRLGIATVVDGLGVSVVELDRLIVIRDRAVKLLLARLGVAALVGGFFIARLERDRPFLVPRARSCLPSPPKRGRAWASCSVLNRIRPEQESFRVSIVSGNASSFATVHCGASGDRIVVLGLRRRCAGDGHLLPPKQAISATSLLLNIVYYTYRSIKHRIRLHVTDHLFQPSNPKIAADFNPTTLRKRSLPSALES
jgi:hypothetical protein